MENNLLKKFLVFEEENNLFNWELMNTKFWPIIRYKLYLLLNEQVLNTQVAHPKKKTIRSIFLIFKTLINAFLKSTFLLKKKSTIVFNHPRKILNDDGYYECKYSEHLTGKDTYVFEAPFQESHLNPSSAPNLRYLDLVLNLSRMYSLLAYIKILSNNEFDLINKLQEIIKQEFETEIPNFKTFVLQNILKHKAALVMAKVILNRIKPSTIVFTVAYSDINMPFVQQAKMLGIKTIEQQHGIMGEIHAAYNFTKKQKFNWFPDEIWVWNKFWAVNSRFPISQENILIKGFPFLEKFKKNTKSNEDFKKQIIIISQGPYFEKLTQLAINLSRIIDHEKYQIAFRPHPSELRANINRFNFLLKENILISSENNIYQVFSNSFYQIGVNSTALFEGIDFGLKTFIVKTPGWEVFKNNDIVHMVTNERDIVKYL